MGQCCFFFFYNKTLGGCGQMMAGNHRRGSVTALSDHSAVGESGGGGGMGGGLGGGEEMTVTVR